MEKIYHLSSSKPSYFVAKQHPRSLDYYLSAGLHHKIVGRFTTWAFFAARSIPRKKTRVMLPNSGKIKTKSLKNPRKKSNSMSGGQPKSQEKSRSSGETASGVYSESGPFVNYANADNDSDPDLTKEVVKLSNEVLASARTVFPFDLFPDSVVLDRTTLNITKRTFFFSNDTLSIRIEDILNAHVNVGPFFGSLTIASRILSSEDHFTINNLWRKDAIHLKHMIQGYIIALHNEIEISHLDHKKLIETIRELGHDLNA